MKVAGLQTDIAWEDPAENFRRCEPLLAEAASSGVRLAVLPEMFATGFSMNADKVAPFAEATQEFLSDSARRLGIWVAGGFAEPFDPRPRNACAVFDPEGRKKLVYHKIHPFSLAGEHKQFTPGDAVPTVEIEGIRVTPLICYDLRFPEPFRLAASATDLFLVVANWPSPRISAWTSLLAARAIENQCYVLGVNRVGEGDEKQYTGDSALIDPMGACLDSASEEVALVSGEVHSQEVHDVRQHFSFLADRRPGTYRAIEDR